MTDQAVTSVFASGRMRAIRDLVARIATTRATVLLRGEHGVGKELLARAIHAASQRADKQFIKLNCAMFSGEALEAELFGHEKGALFGTGRLRPGTLETAHQGTLLIEEIQELPPRLQGRLLQVVDRAEFTRLGGDRALATDVRIITATTVDLEADVRARRFREDLYYRLNAIEIVVPPLRQRQEEIPALVAHFADRFNAQYGRETFIAPETMALFAGFTWPGNVEQLEDSVRRIVIGGNPSLIQRQIFEQMAAEPRPRRPVRVHRPPVPTAIVAETEWVRARRRLA
jgi:Nif-specific regulatory protein